MRKLVVAPIHHLYSDPRNPLPAKVDLGDGYTLKEFDDSILTPVLDFFGRYHSEADAEELRSCRYAVYYEYETEDESTTLPQNIASNINYLIMALRIVKRNRAVATLIHLRITGQELTSVDALQVFPAILSLVSYVDHDEDMEHFVTSDGELIIGYFQKIKELYSSHGGTYHKVLNALIFFELAHFENRYQVRLILMVTCLESLFNTSSEQVGYSLRMRCSYFLETDPEKRVELTKLVKKIYNLRSKFVHGQGTPPPILNNELEMKALMMEIENINRKSIRRILDDGLTSLFDNINSLNEEFEKLEQGAHSRLR